MELGWAATIQAILIAISTFYVRYKAKEDAKRVTAQTVSQDLGEEILKRIIALEVDVALVKQMTLKNNGPIDHRGPNRGGLTKGT